MVKYDLLSLHQVAKALELESVRLYRLGRHFRFAPSDPCVPRSVVERALIEPDAESRYRLILDWLLAQGREARSWSPSGPPIDR